MVMLRPGEEAVVGTGERVVLKVEGKRVSSVKLELSAAVGARLEYRHGSYVLEGDAGCSARVAVASADGSPMSERLDLIVSVPGRARQGDSWQLSDIQVSGRLRVDLLDVGRESSGDWRVRSRQFSTIDAGPIDDDAGGDPIDVDPRQVHLAVAVDRSASMGWAFQGPVLAEVIKAVQAARGQVVLSGSRVQWLTYGSASDSSDGPVSFAASDMAAEEIARQLRPAVHSSGSRLATVLPVLKDAELLLAVTDSWPDHETIERMDDPRSAAHGLPTRLAVLLLGIPSERSAWPVDWTEQQRRCDEAGIELLLFGDGSNVQGAVRDWLVGRPPAPRDGSGMRAWLP